MFSEVIPRRVPSVCGAVEVGVAGAEVELAASCSTRSDDRCSTRGVCIRTTNCEKDVYVTDCMCENIRTCM